ncbi:unnamed protein product [Psylliodes chrysocephalus]|uniref:Uncharacterized protein n=1 Tax=Psylliodes chrysocephalus TaxID=3402493 RepID=A0A9P0CHP7_9CUCU|nr:unnamed protein product [Psylliodes chrysocephala]
MSNFTTAIQNIRNNIDTVIHEEWQSQDPQELNLNDNTQSGPSTSKKRRFVEKEDPIPNLRTCKEICDTIVVQLHINLLPLRHIFQYLDRETSGPRVYSEAIGKMLESYEKSLVLNFVPIVNPLPELDAAAIRNLSTDQKYLYEMCYSISRKNWSLNLAARNSGTIAEKENHRFVMEEDTSLE